MHNLVWSEKRTGAASVVINNDTLWVVGGVSDLSIFPNTTEFIKLDQPPVKGPDLPLLNHYGKESPLLNCLYHSMIQYDEKSIYIIGGRQNGDSAPGVWSSNTWIIDPTNRFKIREGPSLNEKRCTHGCAKMNMNGKTVLVVAGGFNFDSKLQSVEILDPSSNKGWVKGLLICWP